MNLRDPRRLLRIQKWIESKYLMLFRHRGLVLALTSVACLCALCGLPKLHVNNTMDVWFSDQTPSYSRYRTFTETFGSDEYLFVSLDMGDVFADGSLAKLNRLSKRFKDIPGVVEVLGLPTATDVRTSADGGIYVNELGERFGVESGDSLRRRVLSDERYLQTLVSKDGTVAVFLLRFVNPKVGTSSVNLVEGILNSERVVYHLGGYIFAQREMDRLTFRDYFLFGSICLVVLAVLFMILFRDLYLTAIFLGDCVLTVGVVLGCMGHVGVPIHLMTGVIPPLLMAMAIADDIHLVERFLRAEGHGKIEDRVALASSEVAIPAILSGLTTFAGFFSLSGGAVPAIGHFGFWSGVGILFTYGFSFLTVPVLLTYATKRHKGMGEKIDGGEAKKGNVEKKLAAFCTRHQWRLIGVFAFLSILSYAGIQKVVVDTQLTNFFKEDSVFMQSMDFIENRFGNTGPVEIVLTSSAPDGLKRVEILQKTDQLIGRLKQFPNIQTVLSLNPVLKTMTQSLHEGHPADYRLPNRRDLLEQELLLLSLSSSGEETLNRYVNSSWTQMRIQARLPRMTNNEALALLDQIQHEAETVFGKGQPFYITGVVEAYSRLDRFILESQMKSLGITLSAVVLVFWLQVGRALWAVLALIPNIFPIVLMFATMGWSGITLNVATATVAAITLGLADDDTVYFFYVYMCRRRSGQSASMALPGALEECSRPLWIATVLNVVGFSIFIFSSFRPTVYFGLLTSEVWILAILAEFLLLPALLLITDRKSYEPRGQASTGRDV